MSTFKAKFYKCSINFHYKNSTIPQVEDYFGFDGQELRESVKSLSKRNENFKPRAVEVSPNRIELRTAAYITVGELEELYEHLTYKKSSGLFSKGDFRVLYGDEVVDCISQADLNKLQLEESLDSDTVDSKTK